MTVKQHGRVLAGVACVALAAAGAGCSSSTSSGSGKPSGMANVAYAGSLTYLNEKVFGPAFHTATGVAYQGQGAGSDALSAEIAAGTIFPNVFQSVGGDPIEALMPKFTKWYVRYAATSIVVAYNPNSRYAAQFKAIASGTEPLKNLFLLMAKSGFKLGRTDPNIDPQGRSFIFMLELAQAKYHLPAGILTKILGGPLSSASAPTIFSETALPSTLQSGQLDASSAYLAQAIQLHLPYITLPADINLGDFALKDTYAKASLTLAGVTKVGKPIVYNVTVIGSKDQSAAYAFVKYLLSAAGRSLYAKAGYTLLTPTGFPDAAAVPAPIRSELGG